MQTPMEVVRRLAKAAGRVMRSQSIKKVLEPTGQDELKDALKATQAANIHPPWQLGQKKRRKSKSKSPPEKPVTE